MNFNEQVYEITRAIPPGKVLNYGTVARLLSNPRASRAVGYALNALPSGSDVPWHRVVGKAGSYGRISLRGRGDSVAEQRIRLEAEGILFDEEGQFPLKPYLWQPDPAEIASLLDQG